MINRFVALGGAEEIGASCYYLEVDGIKLLFDCGTNKQNRQFPDFDFLLQNCVDSFKNLDAIFLSHAHEDHVGALGHLFRLKGDVPIFATKTTKELIRLQFLTYGRDNAQSSAERIFHENEIEKIKECSLLTPFYIDKGTDKEAEITMYPAGHCLGAVMTRIKTKSHDILYTGDFQPGDGVNEMRSLDFSPDILIMNATKAYSPSVKKQKVIRLEKNSVITIRDVSKFLEILFWIKGNNSERLFVGLTQEIRNTAKVFKNLGYNVYGKGILPMRDKEPDVILAHKNTGFGNRKIINGDTLFSNHVSFDELYSFVKQLNPQKIFLVHMGNKPGVISDYDISKKIAFDKQITGKLIKCEQNKIYVLEDK